ncbi:MAG: hypothetical protein ACXADY_16235 [Candidatus Hodarchaeales archaeon]|jgi:hypothetical protein
MLNRSILTSIIGFLSGCLLYYTSEASVAIVLIMGCVGYFLGLILDNADIKYQLETFHFSSIPSTQEKFQSGDIPEASIIYSAKENLTTVSIVFRVKTKPQDFRLSVIKNLQEYQFCILEDAGKTILSLTLNYPECNYPKLLSSVDQKKEFHFNIRERSLDFRNAVQKIVPGLFLSQVLYPDLYGEEKSQSPLDTSERFPHPPPPSSSSPVNHFPQTSNFSEKNSNERIGPLGFPSSSNIDRRLISKELIDYPPSPELETKDQSGIISPNHERSPPSEEDEEIIKESEIMDDLLQSSPIEPRVPDLSPEDVQQLKNHNKRRLEIFLDKESSESPSPSLVSAAKLASIDRDELSSDEVNENGEDDNKELINEKIVDRESEEINNIRIDYSNTSQSFVEEIGSEKFNQDIVDRINKKIEDEINKVKSNPEIQKEMDEVRKHFNAKTASEESSS